MTFKDKIELFCEKNDLSPPKLAELLDLNYQAMMRNIKQNKITMDFILALSNIYPEENLNWWIKDQSGDMVTEPTSDPYEIIYKIEKNLEALKANLTHGDSHES
jgi:plasmid maintenance system antidote protein VapI